MADCEETLRDLYAFLDHEVAPSTREHIEHHLAGCLDCLQAYDFHAELRTVIKEKCRDEVPPGLMDRVRACFGEVDGLP